MSDAIIDPGELRRALGTFATGVTVVTTIDGDGAPRGFTANSFTSVSLDPPLILVCLAKTAASCPVYEAAESFAINILSEDQRDVSAAFASRTSERFASVEWSGRVTGSPVLEGVVAWLDCRMHEAVDAGDHVILIGRIVAYDYTASSPLGFCRGAYVSFGLSRDAVRAAEEDDSTRLLALIEHEEAILVQGQEVAVVPGTAFGKDGSDFVRASFSTRYEKIEEAIQQAEKNLEDIDFDVLN